MHEAGGRASPVAIWAGKLSLSPSSHNIWKSRSCTLPGKHKGANPVATVVDESVSNSWMKESCPHHPPLLWQHWQGRFALLTPIPTTYHPHYLSMPDSGVRTDSEVTITVKGLSLPPHQLLHLGEQALHLILVTQSSPPCWWRYGWTKHKLKCERAVPPTSLSCGNTGAWDMTSLCPSPLTSCKRQKSYPHPYQLQHLGNRPDPSTRQHRRSTQWSEVRLIQPWYKSKAEIPPILIWCVVAWAVKRCSSPHLPLINTWDRWRSWPWGHKSRKAAPSLTNYSIQGVAPVPWVGYTI